VTTAPRNSSNSNSWGTAQGNRMFEGVLAQCLRST
jgi:hypothetical protein